MGAAEAVTIASYRRAGGHAPADDESLEIAVDGRFDLVRTVGGPRVGRFAGTLSAQGLAALTRLMATADSVHAPATGLPPHVTETVSTARSKILIGALATRSTPAGKLVRRMRDLAATLTDRPEHAVAALHLRVADDARWAALASVGRSPTWIDGTNAELRYALFGEHEELIVSGDIAGSRAVRREQELSPGAVIEIPLPADLAFNPNRTLQVQVDVDLLEGDGRRRRARLSAIAGKGW